MAAPRCDEEGHLVYKEGQLLQGRYEMVNTLGEGAFGRVIKCIDQERSGRKVAIKVRCVSMFCVYILVAELFLVYMKFSHSPLDLNLVFVGDKEREEIQRRSKTGNKGA